jgi:Flp pilus assembly protein TadG
LVGVFAGTFEFGYTFYKYNTLVTAVNDGARYASLRQYDSATTTPSAAFLSAVQKMVVYGSPSEGTTPIAPALATSNVNLTVTFTNSIPTAMTVSIQGYTIDSIFAKTTINKPKVTYPYLGIFEPY